MNQKVKNPFWVDEAGLSIPISRVSSVERLMERRATELQNKALGVNRQLTELKEQVKSVCNEVYTQFMESKGLDASTASGKGNFTWYNFDRSIKIEVAVSERITFDDLTIKAAQDELNRFITDTVESKYNFVKDMVRDAFATSRGKLDAKKVMSLLKYRDRINHEVFSRAAELIEQSIRRPDHKMYFRIWLRDESGQYNAVELNFSNI